MKRINFTAVSIIKCFMFAFVMLSALSSCKGTKEARVVLEKFAGKITRKVSKDLPAKLDVVLSKEKIPQDVRSIIKNDVANSPVAEKKIHFFLEHPNYLAAYSRISNLPVNFKYDENLIMWISSFDRIPKTFKKDIKYLNFGVDELGQCLQIKIRNKIIGTYRDGIISCKAGKKGLKGITSSNPILNLPAMKNSIYKVDDKFIYQTNEYGQTIEVKTLFPLKLAERGRNIRAQSWVNVSKNGILRSDPRTSDAAGHIIGNRFEGPSELINLFPQKPEMNIGEWKKMEDFFAKQIENGHKVMVMYLPKYGDNGLRPISIDVSYSIDEGKIIHKTFSNI